MLLLRDGDALEREGDVLESFLTRHFGEPRVQAGPLVLFSSGCRLEVLKRRADLSCRIGCGNFNVPTLKEVEVAFAVLLFLPRGLLEDIGDLHQAFLAGGAGKVCVPVSRLRFPGKGHKQVPFGFSSLDIGCHFSPRQGCRV